VLEALLHKGPLPVNTIGPKVHRTPGSISVAVDRLLEKGLVSRAESSEDRRVGTNSAFASCSLKSSAAIAMRDGPEVGLTHIDAVLERGELANYYLAHSARADMCRRLGRTAVARSSYEKALALTQQEPERQFLQERIRQLK
jgi:MarR family